MKPLTALVDDDGVAIEVTADICSLSELMQRATELEVRLDVCESERHHARAALEAVPQILIITDPFDNIVLLSDAAARTFGVTDRLKVVGYPVGQLIPEAGLRSLVAETRELHTRGARRSGQRTLVTTAGHRTFDISLMCVCDQDDGDPSPWGVVVQLEESNSLARQGVAELTAAVAHELRTPLAAVRAYTEMLLDGEADDPVVRREFLSVIASETERLTRLVESMHLLARIEAGQAHARCEPVPLVDVVRRAVGIMGPEATAKNLAVEIAIPKEGATPGAAVLGDGDLLLQAVLNVLSNAVKYTAPGGIVRVSVRLDESASFPIRVEVSDTGVGIPPKDVPLVFNKFFRARCHRGMVPGSGLGLPLVRQIVDVIHAGRSSLESQYGLGTTVRLDFPSFPPPRSSDPRNAPDPRNSPDSQK